MCKVEYLMQCGVCCLLLSIWAVIQLVIMGVFYKFEATPLIEDVEAHVYEDYDHFISLTKKNYLYAAIKSWVAAGVYFITGALSIACIVIASQIEKKSSMESDDDEIFCATNDAPGRKKEN